MKFLNRQECADWMRQRLPSLAEIDPASCIPDLRAGGLRVVGHQFPGDSGHKVSLSKTIHCCTAKNGTVLIYLQNLHIWPSSGHLPLLDRLRQAWGESRPIDDSPGYVCNGDEHEDAISLLVLALEFYWDCLIVSEDGRRATYISHDEYYDFFSIDELSVDEFVKMLG